MAESVRLVTLNIDGDNNLPRVLPYLHRVNADVVCLQEVFSTDMPAISEALGREFTFAALLPMTRKFSCPIGFATFSRMAPISYTTKYFQGDPQRLLDLDESTMESRRRTENRAVAVFMFRYGGLTYQIAHTHFTWTPDGKPDKNQTLDMADLIQYLERRERCVLLGDINAPRGGIIYTVLSDFLKDNIPPDVQTTIYNPLHRNPNMPPLVVDGVFSSSIYQVFNVKLVGGLSDHFAVECDVALVPPEPTEPRVRFIRPQSMRS